MFSRYRSGRLISQLQTIKTRPHGSHKLKALHFEPRRSKFQAHFASAHATVQYKLSFMDMVQELNVRNHYRI